MGEIEIQVNGEARQCMGQIRLPDLLVELGMNP